MIDNNIILSSHPMTGYYIPVSNDVEFHHIIRFLSLEDLYNLPIYRNLIYSQVYNVDIDSGRYYNLAISNDDDYLLGLLMENIPFIDNVDGRYSRSMIDIDLHRSPLVGLTLLVISHRAIRCLSLLLSHAREEQCLLDICCYLLSSENHRRLDILFGALEEGELLCEILPYLLDMVGYDNLLASYLVKAQESGYIISLLLKIYQKKRKLRSIVRYIALRLDIGGKKFLLRRIKQLERNR